MSAKKIDLVRQMLAKAESTTPEEAEALTAAAEKIMLRLGIDDAMLAASGKTEDTSPVTSKSITFVGPYNDGMLRGMYAVLVALQTCTAIRTEHGKRETMKIFGRESQIDRAIMLMQSLEIQATVAMRSWWKANRDDYYYATESQKRRVRRQFIISFGSGAADRIKSERTQVETEVTGSALVLLNEVGRAKAALYEEHPNLRRGRALRGGGRDAHESGRAAGQRANVGTTAVGNRKRISA